MYQEIREPFCALGENPLWRSDTKEFYWTDIINGTVYAWNGRDIPRTVLKTSYQTGAFLFDTCWNLLLLTEKGVFLSRRLSQKDYDTDFTLLWNTDFTPGQRFNDAISDPFGQVIAGVKAEDNRNGVLYRYRKDSSDPEILLSQLSISNGMGFSPDTSTFYHTDSGHGTITAYDYASSSPLTSGRILYQAEDLNSVPDGITVDTEGNIWFARWGGGCVVCISPEGNILDQISLPALQVSSITFGGENLDQLFVTSAYIGSNDDGRFLGGYSYLLSCKKSGKPEYRVL